MLVAVVLLGVGIAACVACIGTATRASGAAEELTAVRLMAREELTKLELQGVADGEDHGDFGPDRPGFGWQTVSKETDTPGLRQVVLTILWGPEDHPKKAEFRTFVREKAGS
jgi:hypothetical protein